MRRAVAAERKAEELQAVVSQLRSENERLRNALSAPALEHVKLAASHLRKASTDAKQHIQYDSQSCWRPSLVCLACIKGRWWHPHTQLTASSFFLLLLFLFLFLYAK